MKAIVSTTYDDKYLFFLPIITWCWNKLGVDVICFMPQDLTDYKRYTRHAEIINCISKNEFKVIFRYFDCPEHKEATYAQVSRLFISGINGIDENEMAFCSDIDMANFKLPPYNEEYDFTVFGSDLTPKTQYPVCYVSGSILNWRKYFNPSQLTYQKILDNHLAHIECDNFRGNYWSYEQEQIYNTFKGRNVLLLPRARPGTQFAVNRVDRDDINWRSYCGPSLIDAHLWRPGYEENNFNNILELLHIQYPEEDFQWLVNYRNEYIKLL